MPKEFSRARRVEEQIKRELAVLVRDEVETADLGLITFTAVDVTADLSVAKVYFTSLGSDENKLAVDRLNAASSHLRHCLSRRLTIRSTPRLNFYYDVSIERGNRIESLLDDINGQKP